MADDFVSLDPTLKEETQVSIDPGIHYVPENIAADRASKAAFIKAGNYEDIYNDIVQGRESWFRDAYTQRLRYAKQLQLNDALALVASRTDRTLTPEATEYIRDLVAKAQAPINPNSVVEQQYGKKVVDTLDQAAATGEAPLFKTARATQPEVTEEDSLRAQLHLVKPEYLKKKLQDISIQIGQQSTAGAVADFFKSWVPGYTEYFLRNNVPGVGFFTGVGKGGNIREQQKQLFLLPNDQFIATVDNVVNYLANVGVGISGGNPQLAREWLNKMLSYSYSDEALDNLWTVFDTASIPGLTLGKAAARGVKDATLSLQVRRALKEHIKRSGSVKEAEILESAGAVGEAGIKEAAEKAVKDAVTPKPQVDVLASVSNVFKLLGEKIRSAPSNLRAETVNRFVEEAESQGNKFYDALANSAKVERLPFILRSEMAVRAVLEAGKKNFPGVENSIMNSSQPYIVDPTLNLYGVDYFFGNNAKETLQAFSFKPNAQKFIDNTGLTGAEVVEHGGGYIVRVPTVINETQVRDQLLSTSTVKTPHTLVNSFLGGAMGRARTPEDTLSELQRINRKIAAYAPSGVQEAIYEMGRDITKLRSWRIPGLGRAKKWREWNDVLEASKLARNGKGEVGWFDTPEEFANFFYSKKQRLPDEQEQAAYWGYKKQAHALSVLDELNAYRNKARLGLKNIKVYALTGPDETMKVGGRKETVTLSKGVEFEGERLTSWPTRSDTILIMGNRVGGETITTSDNMKGVAKKVVEGYKADVVSGARKLYRIQQPGERPFAGFGVVKDDSRIRYVLTSLGDETPLKFKPAELRHPVTEYDNYLGQASVSFDRFSGKYWYEKDNIISAHMNRAVANDMAKHMNEVRKFLKDGREDLASAYVSKHGLPFGFDEARDWFKPGKTPEGKIIPPRLNLDEEIKVIPRNQTVGDLSGDTLASKYNNLTKDTDAFRDGTAEGYGKYIDNRDPRNLFTFHNEGTRSNPLWTVKPVKFVDPITSLNRSLNKAVSSFYMDDYKIFSVEHWLREASEHLDVQGGDEALRAAPFYHFFNAPFRSGMDPNLRANLETARFQIKQYIGVQSQHEVTLHGISQALADARYTAGGKSDPIVPGWLLGAVKDPGTFLRSMTYHLKMGLGSIPQFLVQVQTYSAIWGIAGPQHASSGTAAAMMYAYSRINRNPKILDKYDDIMTRMGFRPGEFKEAMSGMEANGFHKVTGTHILQDNPWKYDFVSTGRKAVLDMGAMPFRAGEQAVRYGAWFTAYKEFRATKPTGALTRDDWGKVLNRADLLSANMSRASASTWQQGIFSIPLQFLSYQIRMLELMLGRGRLTGVERLRLAGVNAALYGVPGALGLTGAPLGDWWQQKARDNGYVIGEKWWSSLMNEGIPAYMTGMLTGKWYNVSERYALQGMEQVRDFFTSDRTTWEIFLGVGGTTLVDMFNSSVPPMYMAIKSGFRQDGPAFKLTSDHLMDFFKNASGVNNLWRAYMAVNYGKWYSKKENYLTDADKTDAVVSILTGLSPAKGTDLNFKQMALKDQATALRHAEDTFVREFRRGLRVENDPQTAQSYYNNAFAALQMMDVPFSEHSRIISNALKGYESLARKVDWKYYMEKVPPSRAKDAAQALQSQILR